MKDINILHITDFHIANPDGEKGEKELLRSVYYKEYIGSLVKSIQEHFEGIIHCIIITGDFVDKGNVDCFNHCEEIINYLVKKLGLYTQNVAVCIGNHDLIREKEKEGKPLESRESYSHFAQKFANGKINESCERAILCTPVDGVNCLMIDATLGSKGKDCPGTLKIGEADELINMVSSLDNKKDLLIIGTHYPLETIPGWVIPSEYRWFARHFWSDGVFLRERIRKIRGDAVTLWLCGDVHSPKQITNYNQHFVITGRLGTRTGKKDSHVLREAKVITISEDIRKVPKILTFKWEIPIPQTRADCGYWKCSEAEITVVEEAEVSPRKSLTKAFSDEDKANTINGNPEIIDEDVETTIVETIRDSRLYRLGRFITSEEEVSLSWISVGPLMNEGKNFPKAVSVMSVWLKNKLEQSVENWCRDVVLLGIDCWGATIASQLSILTGAYNFCIAARGRGEYHTSPYEVVSPNVIKKISDSKVVVLVTDIVATGRSLKFLYDKVMDELEDTNGNQLKWLAISVICDSTFKRSVDLSFLYAHGIICGKIKMPILPTDALPDIYILPPDITFI